MANEEKERAVVGLLYEFESITLERHPRRAGLSTCGFKVIRVCTQAQYEKDWWTWGDEYREKNTGIGRQISVGMCILEMDGVALPDGMGCMPI